MTEWRYIARRALTGELLEWELPLSRDALRWDLSGPGSLRGTVAPDVGLLRAADGRLLLEEWGTMIYAEANGQIRWGGIVVSSRFEGKSWIVEAAGVTTYPHGLPYTGKYTSEGVDPADVVRHLWQHAQSQPDGNLGVTVTGTTKVRIGTKEEPYELLWHEAPDMGSEIDALAQAAPFDYVERHAWDGDAIRHEVVIGYPRLGRRRTDLAFVHGDNVSAVGSPEIRGDDFANEILVLGAGEGEGSKRRTAAVRDGRLRRVSVYTAKDVSDTTRLDRLAASRLTSHQAPLTIPSIVVRDHPSAPLGSWDVGDDILVEATLPWVGEVSLWHRITGWELVSDTTASLSLARSDTFTYGG